jgi:hypothetical protein
VCGTLQSRKIVVAYVFHRCHKVVKWPFPSRE